MHRERLLRIMRWMQEARDIRKIGAWKQRLTNPDHGSGIWPRWSELHRNSSISGGFEMNLVLQTSNIPRNLSEIRPKFVHFSWDWIFFPNLIPKPWPRWYMQDPYLLTRFNRGLHPWSMTTGALLQYCNTDHTGSRQYAASPYGPFAMSSWLQQRSSSHICDELRLHEYNTNSTP